MRATLLAILLLAGGFPVPPPASAQPPSGAPGEATDGTGDQFVNVSVLGKVVTQTVLENVPTNAATSVVDLRRILIENEDDFGIDVVITVESIRRQGLRFESSIGTHCPWDGQVPAEFLPGRASGVIAVDFDLEGAGIHYQAIVGFAGSYGGSDGSSAFYVERLNAALCFQRTTGQRRTFTEFALESRVDESSNQIRLRVPKAVLMGQGAGGRGEMATGPDPLLVRVGDRLTGLHAESAVNLPASMTSFLAPITVRDVAPDTGFGAPYAFFQTSPNTAIRLRLPSGSAVNVPVGENWTVPVSLGNFATSKRLVRLSYEFEAPDGQDHGYHAWGPSSIGVPARDWRNFSLSVETPENARAPDNVSLIVRGESLGFKDEFAYAAGQLVPSFPIGPERSHLYIHGRPDPMDSFFPSQLCLVPTMQGACFDGFLSALAEDPEASQPDHVYAIGGTTGSMDGHFRNFEFLVRTDGGAAKPLLVNASRPFHFNVLLRPPADVAEAKIEFTATYRPPNAGWGGDVEIAKATTTTSLSAAGTTVNVSATMGGSTPLLIPAGNTLGLRMVYDLSPSAGAALGLVTSGIEVVGGQSYAHWPLMEPPSPSVRAASGFFQLAPVVGDEEFVNPGESRLFNLTLLNQAERAHVANLTLHVEPPTWRARLLPGDSFFLKPGDAIRVGVLLRAPADAREGERASVWVNVSEASEPPASLRLSSTAIKGVELADDAQIYRADADAQERLVRPPAESPSIPFWAMALVVLLAVWRRRR